jgi:oligosaccharyl transferase (archaeosortase A-associated)
MSGNDKSPSAASLLSYVERWYHVAGLAVLFAYMLFVRLKSYGNFLRDGKVFFSGNDAYYHLRQVRYTVEHFPAVMPFDPWTYFPYGTSVGQFGTLYDQIVAAAALVVGLGNPSDQTIALTLLVAPAVFGALVAIPVYYIGKRLGGRPGGLFAVFVLALSPGLFLSRGLVGSADHNVVEPLFQALGVLGTMVAVGVAHREKPVWEQVLDRDAAGLRKTLGWGVLGGVTVALYVWVWPPAILLIGILGVFYLLRLSADYYTGQSPEHIAFAGATSMVVAGLLSLLPLTYAAFETTQYSLLQPLLAFAVAAGCVFLAWLGRAWDARDLDRSLYPVAVGGIVLAGTLLVWLALPDLFNLFRTNLVRFVGFGAGAATRTISEAQPLLARNTFFDAVYGQYGLTFFTAIAGALLMLGSAVFSEKRKPEHALVLVWAAFITSAAFTQVRFNYYLAVVVAVLNAYLLAWILDRDFFGTVRDASDITASHVFVVLAVLMVVTVPLTVSGTGSQIQVGPKAGAVGSNAQPGAVVAWDGTFQWMDENTPAEGNYGGAENAAQLDLLGAYERPPGADYDYPSGAYGVMSWWDYGHWITVEGERIPNANPFQEGAQTAANFLLAPNETDAENVLTELDESDAKTRYAMVDWQMATPFSKFQAPPVFYNRNGTEVQFSDFASRIYAQGQNGQLSTAFFYRNQRYYESMVTRLYEYHGSAVDPRAVVVDWDLTSVETGQGPVTVRTLPEDGQAVRRFQRTENATAIEQAEAFVANDSTSSIGGVGQFPSERVAALEHYRVVKVSNITAYSNNQYRQLARQTGSLTRQAGIGPASLTNTVPSWVKLFERVPGATIEGEAPANKTVAARARMRVPTTNQTFVYTQYAETGADGEFTMTLPYSTEGYDQWGTEEGYTDVAVRATTNYSVATQDIGTHSENNRTWLGPSASARVDVPEANVIGENETAIQVTLTPPATGSDTAENDTAANGTATSALTPPATPEDVTGDQTSVPSGSAVARPTG